MKECRYGCIHCRIEYFGRHYDRSNYLGCNRPLLPISQEEVKTTVPLDVDRIYAQLEYLDLLIRLSEQAGGTPGNKFENRIDQIFNSIEKSLGLNDSINVGDVKVKLSIDNVEEVARHLYKKIKSDGVQL